jgi:hypothetical protein
MKATLSLLIVGFTFYSTSSQAATPAEAAELGVHKVDRLITLKKIDPSFTSQLVSMTAVATPAGFNVNATEGAASDGSSRMLMMTANKDGKILTYMEMGTKAPATPVALPNNNALTLMELGMHCVQGELIAGSTRCADFADAKLYNDHFKSSLLTMKKDAIGKVIGADITIKGDGLTKSLIVSLANDGSLLDIIEL